MEHHTYKCPGACKSVLANIYLLKIVDLYHIGIFLLWSNEISMQKVQCWLKHVAKIFQHHWMTNTDGVYKKSFWGYPLFFWNIPRLSLTFLYAILKTLFWTVRKKEINRFMKYTNVHINHSQNLFLRRNCSLKNNMEVSL